MILDEKWFSQKLICADGANYAREEGIVGLNHDEIIQHGIEDHPNWANYMTGFLLKSPMQKIELALSYIDGIKYTDEKAIKSVELAKEVFDSGEFYVPEYMSDIFHWAKANKYVYKGKYVNKSGIYLSVMFCRIKDPRAVSTLANLIAGNAFRVGECSYMEKHRELAYKAWDILKKYVD